MVTTQVQQQGLTANKRTSTLNIVLISSEGARAMNSGRQPLPSPQFRPTPHDLAGVLSTGRLHGSENQRSLALRCLLLLTGAASSSELARVSDSDLTMTRSALEKLNTTERNVA